MRHYFLVVITFLFSCVKVDAQNYNFISYSTESGLAQSQIRCITQDDNGFLWLGTLAGLSRYDGKKFVNYSIKQGLLDNQISSLVKDRKAGLWIGTMGGLSFFNGKTFRSFPFKEGMSENLVNTIVQDSVSDLWLATDGAGIAKFNGEIFTYYTEEQGLVNDNVRSLCTDQNGKLWCGTKNGICIFDGLTFKEIKDSTAPINVSHIFMDRKHRLWISTFGEGIYCYDKGVFTQYNETQGLISDWIRAGMEDSQGNIWFASKFGLCRLNPTTKIFTAFTETEGLPVDNNNLVFEDKEKNIWIGSEARGLCKFLGEMFTYLTVKDGLSSNVVMSVLEDPDGTLWFSTFGKGITRMHNGAVTTYSTDNVLNSRTIWASLTDRNGRRWFCTSDGISCFEGNGFRHFSTNEGLAGRIVYAICEDSQGRLWLGTTLGVSVFDGKSFKNFSHGTDPIGKDVVSIIKDKHGTLWFASKSGLYKFENDRFTHFSTVDGLTNNHLVSMALDPSGHLWIASKEGLMLYNQQRFEKVPVEELFSSNTISFLHADIKGNLWIGTNGGIYFLDGREYLRSRKLRFRHYTIFDGLPGMECNQNAAYSDSKGNIWMGTTDGVIRYDPNIREFHSFLSPPITHISSIRLFSKDTNWAKFGAEIDPITLLPRDLKLNHRLSHLTFDYMGIKLSNPSSVRYKYFLDGFDEGWSVATDANFATYSNLPSGKYTFKVIAGDVMGNWNSAPVTFSFEILPPFWTRWWFIVLCVIVGLCILWGSYWLRLDALRKKHQTQQLEYKSRLMLLEHQSLNSSMNRHFIFNALNSIQYYMNKEDKDSAHKYLSRFAKLIRINLDSSMTNLVAISEEIVRLELYLQIELLRFEKRFTYTITVKDDVDTESVQIPPMLLQPYVENSILHGILPSGREGSVDIRVEHGKDQSIIISIEDNGIGVEESKNRKKDSRDPHISRGTTITAQRLELLGMTHNIFISVKGPYEMKDENGAIKGTRVELTIH